MNKENKEDKLKEIEREFRKNIASAFEISTYMKLEDFGYEDIEDVDFSSIYCEILGYISGESDNYKIEFIEHRGGEGDGATQYKVYKITNKSINEENFMEFSGRYSSWDSSDYYSCEVVYPRKIETTVYETKLELKN